MLKTGYVLKDFLGLFSFKVTVRGDLDGDGKVTAADARLVLRNVAKLENFNNAQNKAGDMDASYTVTAADARTILRIAANLES